MTELLFDSLVTGKYESQCVLRSEFTRDGAQFPLKYTSTTKPVKERLIRGSPVRNASTGEDQWQPGASRRDRLSPFLSLDQSIFNNLASNTRGRIPVWPYYLKLESIFLGPKCGREIVGYLVEKHR